MIKTLQPASPRGRFFIAGACPACQNPIYVHAVDNVKDMGNMVMPTCVHNIDDVMLQYPGDEDVPQERVALMYFFEQLMEAVSMALFVSGAMEEDDEQVAGGDQTPGEHWDAD